MKKWPVISMLLVLFISPLSYGQNAYMYSQPQELKDGWETNNLKSQEIDSSRIYQLFTQLQNGKNKMHFLRSLQHLFGPLQQLGSLQKEKIKDLKSVRAKGGCMDI